MEELDAELAAVLADIDAAAPPTPQTGTEPMGAPVGPPSMAPPPPPMTLAGDEAPTPEEALSALPPDTIQAVSQDLVDMGYLEAPTDRVTPDFKAAMQALVTERMPGMFDLGDPVQLVEAIRATDRGELAGPTGGPGPVPSPGGGGLPGGAPGGAVPGSDTGPKRLGSVSRPSPTLGLG